MNLIEIINSKSKALIIFCKEWGFTLKGIISNQKGEWWLCSQATIIIAHFIPNYFPIPYIGIILQKYLAYSGTVLITLGIYQFLKSIYNLGLSLSPLPDPKLNSKLITNGIYMNCRHPLYKSLIFISAGLNLQLLSLVHLFLFFSLILILKSKAVREENKLLDIYPVYRDYMKNTPAIFEYIFFLDWRKPNG